MHAIYLIDDIGSLFTQTNHNDACTECDASGNTTTLGVVPENKVIDTADHELRPRIESFNTQPKARSPSFVGENEQSHDIHKRTGSVGTGEARRPSFLKEKEGVSFYYNNCIIMGVTFSLL